MKRIKDLIEVKTTTHQLVDDTVTDSTESQAGTTAYKTFMREDTEISNDKYIPFRAIDHVKVAHNIIEQDIVDDTCNDGTEPTPPEPGAPVINGANNVTINQGIGIDLRNGITATLDGETIDYSVSPDTIEKCEVGEHIVTYTATGNEKTTTVERKVTINQIANPTISGLSELTVDVGEEFDPLEGVSAVDGNGNPVEVEIIAPIYSGEIYFNLNGDKAISLTNFTDEDFANIKSGDIANIYIGGNGMPVSGASSSNPVFVKGNFQYEITGKDERTKKYPYEDTGIYGWAEMELIYPAGLTGLAIRWGPGPALKDEELDIYKSGDEYILELLGEQMYNPDVVDIPINITLSISHQ